MEDRVLLVAVYSRTNLTMRQPALLFGISKSAADRIIDHVAPVPFGNSSLLFGGGVARLWGSESRRCTSGRVSVLVDDTAEDAAAQ